MLIIINKTSDYLNNDTKSILLKTNIYIRIYKRSTVKRKIICHINRHVYMIIIFYSLSLSLLIVTPRIPYFLPPSLTVFGTIYKCHLNSSSHGIYPSNRYFAFWSHTIHNLDSFAVTSNLFKKKNCYVPGLNKVARKNFKLS